MLLVSTSLTRDETNWLANQVRRLKLVWELLNSPACLEVMKKALKAVAELNGCGLGTELVDGNEWTILACDGYTIGVTEYLVSSYTASVEPYRDWLAEAGVFGVGIDIVPESLNHCHIRLFKQGNLEVNIRGWVQYYIEDVSLQASEPGNWYLFFIVSQNTETPPEEIYAYFDKDLNFSSIGKSIYYREPVEPEEILKALINNQEVRSRIEETINEFVTRVIKIYTPYLLY